MYRFLFLILVAVSFIACEKDEPIVNDPTSVSTEFDSGLFFVNEGQFNQANASLSFYNVENDSLISKAYEIVNNQPIGDILQAITYDENNLYFVVNNSGKIIVADKKSLNFKGEITGLPSPRYMEYSGNGDLWYVSNLFNDSLFVVNTKDYSIERKEYIGVSTEAMKVVDEKLYMSSSTSRKLIVKDLNSNTIDSILVSIGGNSLVTDNNKTLWLLCNGDFYTPGTAYLYQIDPIDQKKIQEIKINEGYPTKLTYNSKNNNLYFINTHIYNLNLSTPTITPNVFIESSGQNFYGVNIINESIFVTNALDFTQNGLVYEYNTNGELLKTLPAGINPNAVVLTQ